MKGILNKGYQAKAPDPVPMTDDAFMKRTDTAVYWLTGAGIFINCRGTTILVDPVLSLVSENPPISEVDGAPQYVMPPLSPGDIKQVDAVLYTHGHADHTKGIDDLRPFYFLQGHQPLPVYAEEHILQDIMNCSSYLFGAARSHPWLVGHVLEVPWVRIRDMTGLAIPQDHRDRTSFGFRFGTWAYSTDVYDLSEEALQVLEGIQLWIVGGLSFQGTSSHAPLDRVLSWVDRLRPQRTILTHMNNTMDYDTLQVTLPKGVEPGFDGLSVRI
jgi:phosphoribosyl 1,2-cyclic phosphate phosphodiesterase